jgi:hypothetical protein
MVTWVVVGAIVLGVVILVAAVGAVAGRVPPLADAGRRLRLRSEQAQRLQVKAEALQQHMADLQLKVAETAARAEQAGRHRRDD